VEQAARFVAMTCSSEYSIDACTRRLARKYRSILPAQNSGN
jgi:hypothetical protein